MIVIIDYGTSNANSVKKMIQKLDPFMDVKYSNSISEIKTAEKLILPGVGAFDSGISELKKLRVIDLLYEKVQVEKVPILGICLGMQLMMEKSEEGKELGLGFLKGQVKKFAFTNKKLPIPHMGWNFIKVQKENRLIDSNEITKFYFVHSYYVQCHDKEDVLAKSKYGFDFDAAFQRDNIYGVQFHPEKSHLFGEKILKNFIAL